MQDQEAGSLLLQLFQAALGAADPRALRYAHLPTPQRGRFFVVGAGKAAASMAASLEAQSEVPLDGMVVVPYGHGLPVPGLEVCEAAHPLPDDRGVDATRRMLEFVSGLRPDDHLVCLLSGGASSLLCLPAEGLPLSHKQSVIRALLRSGAPISQINTVRKHLSAVKGGRLAVACPAPVHTVLVSDVPGDDPAVIGSGPTLPDPGSCRDALAVIEQYRIDIPDGVRNALVNGDWESPKPGDARLARGTLEFMVRPRDALEAAATTARRLGLRPVILGDAIEGEAREVAKTMALQARRAGGPRPAVLLSGGETSVTVQGGGHGGRNTEFLLALGIALGGQAGIHALACDTDGIDGRGDHAGAVLHPGSLARLAQHGEDPVALLEANDSRRAFAVLGDLVITGPTLTNVNDFRAILVH